MEINIKKVLIIAILILLYSITVCLAQTPDIDLQRPDGNSIPNGGTDNVGNLVVGVPTIITYICEIDTSLEFTDFSVSDLINCSYAFGDTIMLQPWYKYSVSSYDGLLLISVTPTVVGPFSLDLSITSNDPDDNPYIISVQGVGITSPGGPDIKIYGNGQLISNGEFSPNATNHTALDYSPRTFTIQNEGIADLLLTGAPNIILEGPYAQYFEISSQPAASVITPGSSTTFTVTLKESHGISDGLKEVIVNIPHNNLDKNPYVFKVAALSVGWKLDGPIPDIDVQRPSGTSIVDGGTDDIGFRTPGYVNIAYIIGNGGGLEALEVYNIVFVFSLGGSNCKP